MIQTMDSYAAAFHAGLTRARTVAQAIPAMASEAAAFCDRLAALGAPQQRSLLRSAPPALVAAAFGEFAQRARRSWTLDVEASLDSADCLLRCARAVKGPTIPKSLRADLRAEAWAIAANGLRLAERHGAAERAWRRARLLLDRGSGDAGQLAELAWMEAALAQAQRRFVEATDLLQLAHRQFERIQDVNGLEQVTFAKADLQFRLGDSCAALATAHELLGRVDGRRTPERAVYTLHLLFACYIDLGEYDLALEWYHLYERFYAELGGMLQVRADWLKGRLCVGLGKWSAAETYFERLRGEFLTRGLEFDAALVGVELALCRAEQRDLAGVRRLVEEMYPVFCSKKLPQEAAATLILFANTARAFRIKIAQLADLGAEIKTLARSFGR